VLIEEVGSRGSIGSIVVEIGSWGSIGVIVAEIGSWGSIGGVRLRNIGFFDDRTPPDRRRRRTSGAIKDDRGRGDDQKAKDAA
jgi:hypothetical protein